MSPEQDFATKAQVRLQAIPNPEDTTASKTRVRVRDRVSGRVWQWRALGGQRVLESSVNNTHVAWVERVSIGKRATLVVWIRRLRPTIGPPKVIARTTVSRKLTARGKGYGDVALLIDGSIAWTFKYGGVMLKRPGKRPFLVSRNGVGVSVLGADTGRTLWWVTRDGEGIEDDVVLRDVLPREGQPCETRLRFDRYFAAGGIVASHATFFDFGLSVDSQRICLSATGEEYALRAPLTVQGTDEKGRVLLLGNENSTAGCRRVDAQSWDVRRRKALASGFTSDETWTHKARGYAIAPGLLFKSSDVDLCAAFAGRPSDVAFADDGAVAWVIFEALDLTESEDSLPVDGVFAISPGGSRITLIGAAETVGGLSANGDGFTWSSNGVTKTWR